VARSFALRPVLVTEQMVVVRCGLLWTAEIPRDTIRLEAPGAVCDLRVPMLADTNVVMQLARPVSARGLYGTSRVVSSIALGLDDAAGFTELH
jgi:hypothetical protein